MLFQLRNNNFLWYTCIYSLCFFTYWIKSQIFLDFDLSTVLLELSNFGIILDKKWVVDVTWHADATEGPRVIKTGAVVLARVTFALVHVSLTPRSCEALRAVAGKWAWGVHADSIVLAWRSCIPKTKTFSIDINFYR